MERIGAFFFAIAIGGSVMATDAIVSSDIEIADGDILEISVADGDTCTYSGVISGKGGVRKVGAGTLVLSGENAFEGGFDLACGKVKPQTSTAFGSGAVNVTASESAAQIVMETSGLTFANGFNLTGSKSAGSSSAPTICINANVTFDGDITFVKESWIGPSSGAPTVVFNGSVGTASCGFIYTSRGEAHFKGSVRATNFYAGLIWSHTGWSCLYSADDTFAKSIYCMGGNVRCMEDNVLGSAALALRGKCAAYVDLNGYNQTVSALSFDPSGSFVEPASDAKDCSIVSENGAFLTITGMGERSTGFWSIDGAVSLAVDATSEFRQVLSNRINHTTGDIRVRRGTLELGGAASLADANSIHVADGAVFEDNSTIPFSLAHVKSVVVDGTFKIGEGTQNPFEAGTCALVLGAASEFSVPSGMRIVVSSLVVDGESKSNSTGVSQIVGGGSVVVAAGESADSWIGGSAGDLFSDGMNWKSGMEPDVLGGLTATFADPAAVGTTVTMDVDAEVAALNLSSDDGFAFRGEGSLSLNGLLSIAEPTAGKTPTYAFHAPLTLKKSQDLSVPEGVTLQFDNFSFADTRLGKVGAGSLVLSGNNAFAGTVVVSNANTLVTGLITTPSGLDSETILTPGNANANRESALYVHLIDASSTFCLSNAVIEKPLWVKSAEGTYDPQFFAAAGTTNAFKAFLMTADAQKQMLYPKQDAVIAIEGGARFNWALFQRGTGTVLVRDKPIALNASQTRYTISSRGTLVLESVGNVLPKLEVEGDGGVVETRVDGAWTPSTVLELTGSTRSLSSGSALDLNATVQTVARLTASVTYANDASYIAGSAGSMLWISNSLATSSTLSIPVKGAASIGFDNPGTLDFKGCVCTSSGNLEIVNGTVAFDATSSWHAAANVTVRGNGRLELPVAENGSQVFGRDTILHLSESGIISIPSGVAVFGAAYVNGNPIPRGTYAYATAPEALKAHLDPSGAGVIRLCGPKRGSVFVLR